MYNKGVLKKFYSEEKKVNTINKLDLVAAVADKAELAKKEAQVAVDALFDAITEALKEGNKVVISGFGQFEVKERAAREGVNPATGEKISIPATKVPGFKAGKGLKDSVK